MRVLLLRHQQENTSPEFPLALGWKHCDGVQTVDGLAAAMRHQLGPESAPAIVVTSLKRLAEANLQELNFNDVTALEPPPTGVSRRSVMASAAAVGPGMVSILAPTPAAAKSKPDKMKLK
jgi:hypothetical protein